MLAARGDEIELARRAATGDQHAAIRLAELLADRDDEAELARYTDSGNQHAASLLARMLAGRAARPG